LISNFLESNNILSYSSSTWLPSWSSYALLNINQCCWWVG